MSEIIDIVAGEDMPRGTIIAVRSGAAYRASASKAIDNVDGMLTHLVLQGENLKFSFDDNTEDVLTASTLKFPYSYP
jgi:hypothetical protein